MISLKNIGYKIDDGILFDDITYKIDKNKIIGIIGLSGSGKTTLFKLITGLIPLQKGEITLFDQNISELTPKTWRPLRSKIGYMLQHHALFLEQTVAQNIFMNNPIDHNRLAERLKQVDLEGTSDQKASTLSGGMKKRVALARTLRQNPELLLLDDPFSGLDPITTDKLVTILKTYQKNHNGTIVIAARSRSSLRTIATTLIQLKDGTLQRIE